MTWYTNNDPVSIKMAADVTLDLVWEQIEKRIEKVRKEFAEEQEEDRSDIRYWRLIGKLEALEELNDLVKKY